MRRQSWHAKMLKSFYEISQKSKKRWHRIFWHLLNIILYRKRTIESFSSVERELDTEKLPILSSWLFNRHSESCEDTKTVYKNPSKKISAERYWSSQNITGILPSWCSWETQIHIHCSTKTDQKWTIFYCKTCDVPLCIEERTNWYEKYHGAK